MFLLTDSVEERVAREHLEDLINAGRAQEIMEAYAVHSQSCFYVYGIVQHVAYAETDGGINPAVRSFARNLLDDWSK